MAKQFNLMISVTTNADVDEEKAAKLLRMLVDAGLADAQKTVEDDDLCSKDAELALDLNIGVPVVLQRETTVPVKHWDGYGDKDAAMTHQFLVDDTRKESGQAYLSIAANGEEIDTIGVKAEVNTNPLDESRAAPCLHVHFEDDSLAVSLFKIDNKILMRTENGVSIQRFTAHVNDRPEEFFWVEKGV